MASSWCTSCCGGCFISPPPSPISNLPYALPNLLAAGTIVIKLPVEIEHQICDHTHAEDGWHHFRAHLVIPHLSSADDITFCRGLEYLVNECFVSATYRSNHDGLMAVRIYLIPHDLANMQGKLRVRKENILAPARRYLRSLLPKISQDVDKWNGCRSSGQDSAVIPDTKDSRTLADIYSDLASPHVVPVPGYGNIASRLLDFSDDLEGLGMRSKLYRYQRRSVAAMLQKELDFHDVSDPLFIPVVTVDNKSFYLQPGTMEVLQERPKSAPCRGGILCEELGTGKTVMMLSLIVATRNQISTPEPSIIDDRPILTPLSFRHFPSSEFATSRKRLGRNLKHESPPVPSLVELMLHLARTAPRCDIPENVSSRRYSRILEKEAEVNTLPLGKVIRANVPFYHHYLGEPSNRERAQRNRQMQTPRVVYLTSATLVVVPANLLSQWDRETTKHCAVPLRVLILRAKTLMPTVQKLATDYDIILMSYTRLSAEANNQDVSKLHSEPPCTCPEPFNCRVPKCKCKVPEVSPFLQIRWKRLVIDEGHVSSTLSNILVPFAKLLSVERRWIVTGTPTTNLLGLSFGGRTNAEEGHESQVDDDVERDSDVVMDESPSTSYPACRPPSSPASTSSNRPDTPPPSKSRTWNKYDREDLNKLGNMISHFIAVPQFNADSKLVTTHVVEPLLDPNGPRPGAIQVLNQVMEMVMIRHRIEDVEQDVILPPVSQESVLLDLDPYVVKSFNALQASILINAIDSQRTDQDYMFHPRNADLLQETVKNMSQILFWHVNEDLYYAEQLVHDADSHIDRATERGMPMDDIISLQEALKHLRLAIEDPLWRHMQHHEDVPYRVFDLNERVYKAWTRTPEPEPDSGPRQTGFMHADRLLKLYDMVVQKPLIKEDAMIGWGEMVVTRDHVFRKAYEESLRKKGKGRKKAKHSDDLTSTSQMADNFAKKASAADTLRDMQKELDATMARLQRDELEDGGSSSSPPQLGSPTKRPSNLIASSPLAKMRIGSSASTKLNYIINEVQKYSPTEKFLIFSESPLSLAHVAEALELIHVKFLRFTTQVTPQFREQLVLTFETSETYRVFLMELKHGARGLNLISASRVIFCEPVWQADVESQAIKRAHRIGQTRPITVKTLAIRQTAEENMVARRTILKSSQEKIPKLIEEAGMRHYIENPKFITHTPALTPIDEFPLVDLPPELLQPRPGTLMLKIPALPRTSPSLKRVRAEDPINDDVLSNIEEPSPKKKKKALSIRFAVP
ncbi:SNF2 family N-terminal domain-containing protein [Flammula alnicola]|nr:SNF2 family N-terminal domain-containing protein [Flammula alnicola]